MEDSEWIYIRPERGLNIAYIRKEKVIVIDKGGRNEIEYSDLKKGWNALKKTCSEGKIKEVRSTLERYIQRPGGDAENKRIIKSILPRLIV